MKSSIVFTFFLCTVSFVSAQRDTTTQKIHYFNSFHAGGLFGKKGYGSGESFSTIHGIRLHKFALGVGVGYDAYTEWTAVPVFASLRYDAFRLRDNAIFIQLNGGLATIRSRLRNQDQSIYEFEPGTCLHPVLGYSIQSNKFTLYFTAGYKFQAIQYEQKPPWWIGATGSKLLVARDMERLSVQFGFGFR